jgi:hypothetical protein
MYQARTWVAKLRILPTETSVISYFSHLYVYGSMTQLRRSGVMRQRIPWSFYDVNFVEFQVLTGFYYYLQRKHILDTVITFKISKYTQNEICKVI